MASGAHRKLVTVLFCDVVGSTALGESATPSRRSATSGSCPRTRRCSAVRCASSATTTRPSSWRGRELGGPDDVQTQRIWRQAQALVHAARGEHLEAKQRAREAVDFALLSDSPWHQGDAFYDLGRVLEAAGCRDEAVTAWHEALERYERKGVVPLARRVRERLVALEPA